MQKLFLASLFKDVTDLFINFVHADLTGKTVTFIPTAALPDKLDFHIEYSKNVLSEMGLIVDELEISTADPADIASKLEKNEFIYVAGGNTFFLLQEMNRSEAGALIQAQIRSGKLYIGESAGAILAAPDIGYAKDTDNPQAAPLLKTFEALNVIDFYPLPHCEPGAPDKATESVIAQYGAQLPLVPFGNSQAILVTGNQRQVLSTPV